MTDQSNRTIAVLGATGAQGLGVVRALRDQGMFSVRALTRNPAKAAQLAEEVVRADLDQPDTLARAFEGAYGVFANINSFSAPGIDEVAQGTSAVEAAKAAGVEHYIWSTLPDVSAISGGRFTVPHFTNKAAVDRVVEAAGFRFVTFVEPPFYYQNLVTPWYEPKPGTDGTPTLTQPMPSDARGLHVGDITELGNVVAGALAQPDVVGFGQHLSLAGDLLSWDDIITTLRSQGHHIAYAEDPDDPWGIGDMLGYFAAYTYFGPEADAKIAAAKAVSTRPFTDFATWAESNMPAKPVI